MNPTSCRVLHNLADQYHIQGKIQPALASVEQCLAIKKGKLTQPEMINNYVAMLIADKQFARADIVAIDALRYVQEQISRRRILENLGISKLTQKQNSLAEHYLTMATKLPNPYPKTYFALSVSLAKQRKYIDAKKYVEMGLQLEPSNQRGKIILQRLNKLLTNHR
jgi:Tfp pilus assembly protein PilF